MDDEDFQMIVSKEDYEKYKSFENTNVQLAKNNKKLKTENATLTQKVKDLKKSVFVRDSYIQHLVTECETLMNNFLGQQALQPDISQSFYQDFVSLEQNHISSIEMRDALELFQEENRGVLDKFRRAIDQQKIRQKKIQQLERELKKNEDELKEEKQMSKKVRNSAESNKLYELQAAIQQIEDVKKKISNLEKQRTTLSTETSRLMEKNKKLEKENEAMMKKKESCGERSYVLKLMVDEYYSELEKNLLKMGGLTEDEINTVIANEMKGIVQYIDTLTKKASRRY